jgi:hypothetical protein
LAAEKEDKNRFLQVSRLNSIKTRIIVFALLATIIPSVSMGWLSYVQNKKFLNQKIRQELRVVTSQVSRELDLWLKDRLYDVRVFSRSYVVLENLDKIVGQGGAHTENVVALRRLKDYLRSVREKIVDYQELMLLDLKGKIVATSAKQATTVKLPDKWLPRAQANKHTIGQPHWDETLQAGVVVVTQPIQTGNERLLGVLAAKINFRRALFDHRGRDFACQFPVHFGKVSGNKTGWQDNTKTLFWRRRSSEILWLPWRAGGGRPQENVRAELGGCG